MGIRRLTAALVVLALVPALAGCSLLESGRVLDILGSDNDARQELSAVADRLRALPGVERVEQRFDAGVVANPMSSSVQESQVTLEVTVRDEFAAADLGELAELVRAGLASDTLIKYSEVLTVAGSSGPLLEQAYFGMTEEALAQDIDYVSSVRAAIDAPLALGLLTGLEAYDRVVRFGDAATTAALLEDYEAVRAITAPTAGLPRYSLPGFEASGGLPEPEYALLLQRIAAALPLSYWADEDEPAAGGVALWSRGGSEHIEPPSLSFSPAMNSAGEYVEVVGWDGVIEVAGLAAASGIQGVSVIHSTSENYGAVHFGACANRAQASDGDQAFVDRLAADGLPVTLSANGGFCTNAPA
jgi:hypothetical protein